MNGRKTSKFKKVRSILSSFLVFISIFTGVTGLTYNAYAVNDGEENVSTPTSEERNETGTENNTEEGTENRTENNDNDSDNDNDNKDNNDKDDKDEDGASSAGDNCRKSLGALGWVVCPSTGKLSEAVDWLYDKVEEYLVVSPISTEDGSPIYEIWKYCRGITNIVFIIFFLVVIYSQITGLGINNYGIKKTLPKLIVTAMLVNLSFLICSLAVDVSNIVGNSLRGVFVSVEENALATSTAEMGPISLSSMFAALTGGTALTIGAGAIAFETGAIWMLIPVALGAIVAVATGLIMITLRQAVIALLIMISPLAMVAYMLPNTDQWFRKWKDLFTKMLVFYPMFALLFGASSLAGFAIIMSAKNGFGLLLGIAVQIFPLFFAVKLMQMSGTFLGNIGAKIQGLASKPLGTNRGWAESHRALTQQRQLEKKAYTPSLRLMQFLNTRKIERDVKTGKYAEAAKNRALAAYSLSHYNKDGTVSKSGQEDYELQKRNLGYQQAIAMDDNNFNRGLSGMSREYKGTIAGIKKDFRRNAGIYSSKIAGATTEERLTNLDNATVEASDKLKMELARGAKIELDNAAGFHKRISDAMFANEDREALVTGNIKHQFHDVLSDDNNIKRYESMKQIMEGNSLDTMYVAADAAHAMNAQTQIMRGKFKDLFDTTAPTQDVVNLLNRMTTSKNSQDYIGPIISGLSVLSKRGDTDLVARQLSNLLDDQNINLGTFASQSLANYMMFDVNGKDPFLRRFGKYINLETAKMFNEPDSEEGLRNRRTRKDISLYEYVNGEYIDRDENGNVIYENGRPKIVKTRKPADVLMNGTSFKDMERTALAQMNETIRKNSLDLTIDENGNEVGTFSYERFKKNQDRIWNSIMANIIGDQFSYLSGSEQIVALGKGLTGMDVKKHKFDWEGIFGKEIAEQLTPEQKKDYLDFMLKRTGVFLGGQVPSQIARTKTDILEAVKNQYAFMDAASDEETGDQFIADTSEDGFKMSNDEYKAFEREHMENVKKRFVKSYKEDALKGFVKMHHKGYQGEAKNGLIQLLNPDELYQKYFGNGGDNRSRQRTQQRDDDDDEDGMLVVDGGNVGEESIYNETRQGIESVYDSYRGQRAMNVAEFWNEVKEIIRNSSQIEGREQAIEEFENAIGQYTNVGAMYADILERFFGGV